MGGKRLTDAGIELEHSGLPGAVIAAIASIDQSGSQVFDVPLRDPKTMKNVGGSYLWRIDGDNRAVVHLKNIDPLTDGKMRQGTVMLFYDGGSYSFPVQMVEAGQTLAIDIRKLRDEQVKDSHDRVIPLNVTKGQIVWYGRGTLGQFVGRLVQYNPATGTASSFSCGSPCLCDPTFYSSYMTPSSLDGNPGETFALQAWEVDQNCDGSFFVCDVTSIATFTSSNSLVVSVNGSTATIEDQGGEAIVYADWDASEVTTNCNEFLAEGGCASGTCEFETVSAEGSSLGQVRRPSLSGPDAVTTGQSATFTVTNLSARNRVTGWQFSGGGATVTRGTNTGSTTWSGVIVVGGTVTVTLRTAPAPLIKSITVNPRTTGWVDQVAAAQKIPWNRGDLGPGVETGFYVFRYSGDGVDAFQIGSDGPNHGFIYVTGVKNFENKSEWMIHPDVDNLNSNFSQHQFGNYMRSVFGTIEVETGFIGGSQLHDETIRHEIGTTASHRNNQVVAVDQNRYLSFAEQQVGYNATISTNSLETFAREVQGKLDERANNIRDATAVEPPAPNYTAAGIF